MAPWTDEDARAAALRRGILGALLVLGAVLLGLLVMWDPAPGRADQWWNATGRPALVAPALVLDFLGGGWFATFVVPLGGSLALAASGRWWSALYLPSALLLSAGIVQALKHWFARARPEEILVQSDFGSFPSGHTANVATLAVVLVILFPRVWVAVVGALAVLLMALARTVLHAHWLTDTAGGTLAGSGAALLAAAVFALPLLRERDARLKA